MQVVRPLDVRREARSRPRRLPPAPRPRRASASAGRALGARRATPTASAPPTRTARCRAARTTCARAGRGPDVCCVGDHDDAFGAPPASAARRQRDVVRRADRLEIVDGRCRCAPSRARARPRSRRRSLRRRHQQAAFDLKADVHGRRGVRERADGHEIGAGRGQRRQPVERDAAGDLDARAAAACRRRRSRISASGMLSTRSSRRRPRAPRPPPRASAPRPRPAAPAARARTAATAVGHAAGQPHVVVLDQHGVVEPGAMVRRAARAHRVLLERAQRRRRLARVEDDDPAARPRRRTRARSVAMPDSR